MTTKLHARLSQLGRGLLGAFWIVSLALLWRTLTANPRHLLAVLAASYLLVWGGLALIANRPSSEWRPRFALTTFALGFMLFGLEAFGLAGLVDYRLLFGTPAPEVWLNPRNRLDDDLLHIPRPHMTMRGTTAGDIVVNARVDPRQHTLFRYDYRTDHDGFRNDADSVTADIAVLGDSFVQDPLVPGDKLLTSVLAKLLQCRVRNLGQSYYGPQQELVVLKRYALPLKPALCVWAFFEGNDLKDVARYDRLRADWAAQSSGFRSRSDRSFSKNAAQALLRLWPLEAQPDSALNERAGTFRDAQGKTTRLYFAYAGQPLTPSDEHALDKTTEILKTAQGLCTQQGVRFLVVFVPIKYRVYGPFTKFSADSLGRDWVRNDLPERFRERVVQISTQVDYLDLTPVLTERAKAGDVLYFPEDSHWNAEGQAVAAAAIRDYIVKQSLPVKPGP